MKPKLDNYYLIADSGSTKIDWRLIHRDILAVSVESSGVNPVVMTAEEVDSSLRKAFLSLTKEYDLGKGKVWFYGAGCVTGMPSEIVYKVIKTILPEATIEVCSDMLAAAHALCGREPGIACILGTGSNSCLYDGNKIIENVSPLGWILGDEGGGAVLGKLLISNILKNQFSKQVADDFYREYKIDKNQIIERVYRKAGANVFLASFVTFISRHLQYKEIEEMAVNAFVQFFMRNVAQYGHADMPVNFVGSIAYYFHSQLSMAAKISGYELGKVIKSPIDALVDYHCKDEISK